MHNHHHPELLYVIKSFWGGEGGSSGLVESCLQVVREGELLHEFGESSPMLGAGLLRSTVHEHKNLNKLSVSLNWI